MKPPPEAQAVSILRALADLIKAKVSGDKDTFLKLLPILGMQLRCTESNLEVRECLWKVLTQPQPQPQPQPKPKPTLFGNN